MKVVNLKKNSHAIRYYKLTGHTFNLNSYYYNWLNVYNVQLLMLSSRSQEMKAFCKNNTFSFNLSISRNALFFHNFFLFERNKMFKGSYKLDKMDLPSIHVPTNKQNKENTNIEHKNCSRITIDVLTRQ